MKICPREDSAVLVEIGEYGGRGNFVRTEAIVRIHFMPGTFSMDLLFSTSQYVSSSRAVCNNSSKSWVMENAADLVW